MTEAGAAGAADGRIVFVGRRQPPLPAGTFTVTVRQHLRTTANVTREKARVADTYATTRRLAVRGERFALAWAQDPPHGLT